MASALEQAFNEAITAKDIDGVIIEGRNASGQQYSKALGTRTLLDGSMKPLSNDDIIFLASATKVLTTLAALRCCENGQLNLDTDLRPQLPQLCERGVLVGYDGDTPKFEPLRKALTLRHLLTHSSGLLYDFLAGEQFSSIVKWRAASPASKGPGDVPKRYVLPLAFQPGEGWMYGPSIDWAGYVVEQASGVALDEYFRTHLLGPVGVSATELSFMPVKEGLSERMSDVNPKDPKGEGLMAGMGQNVHGEDGVAACFGGQGGYATSQAYVAVLQSILSNDGRILQKETVNSMFQSQLEPLARKALEIQLAGPYGPFFNLGTSGIDCDFGLGGLLVGQDEPDAGLGKGSLAWGGGVNTIWHLDNTNGICGFVSQQFGIPAQNMQKVLELKNVARRELKRELSSTT